MIVGDPHDALSVLSSWRPWNLRSRLQWRAILTAASARALAWLPGLEHRTARIDTTYWRSNLSQFPENWNAVIHVGNRSHTRKAIVFFFDRNGPVEAVAKVPLVPGADRAILNEAAILSRLKRFEFAPRVRFEDPLRGVAIQSWLNGKPVARGFTNSHFDLLCTLTNENQTTRISDRQQAIADSLDQIDLPFPRALLSKAIDFLGYDEPLQEFIEHRDFAPWNLKWLLQGGLGLLDWEWSVAQALPWQDVCRFFFLDDALFHGSGNVWDKMTRSPLLLQYRRRFGIRDAALPGLTMHYLLRVLCADWQSGNAHLARHAFNQIQSLCESNGLAALRL
jgi:hypothetical protein